MKMIYILCEGQTEEQFVYQILFPYFLEKGIMLRAIIIATKRTPTKKYKGGLSSYAQLKKEITILTREHKHELVTTLIDFYGLPADTPGFSEDCKNSYEKVKQLEKAIENDLKCSNFICNINLHEFETFLFSDVSAFKCIAEDSQIKQLESIKAEYSNVELINNGLETAPSKRIYKIIPNYGKVSCGLTICKEIGLNKIISECSHFAQWINILIKS